MIFLSIGGGGDADTAINPYTLPAFGLGGLGLAFFAGGYYFNMKVDDHNSKYDSLYENYTAASNQSEATSLQKKLEAEKEDAEKNALYRNISYGLGLASILTSVYFFYKYFIYKPELEVNRNFENIIDVHPLVFANKPFPSGINTESFFIGCNFTIRF